MCGNTVDNSLAALKLTPDWFVACKITKKLFIALYVVENISYFNEESGNVGFKCNGMGTFNIDLNHINLDNNFDEDDTDTIKLIRHLAWHIKFEEPKAFKKCISEEIIPIA